MLTSAYWVAGIARFRVYPMPHQIDGVYKPLTYQKSWCIRRFVHYIVLKKEKTMKHAIFMVALLAIFMMPIHTHANESAQALGTCLADALNGKERKELAKWIYFGMSRHSTIKQYSKVTDADIDNMNRYIGQLVTRLITADCSQIASRAIKEGGASSVQYAFSVVGQVAMQELMREKSVTKAIGEFEKYLDRDKFDNALK